MESPRMIISQDLSGVGQVSMGVALPIVAALNIEPCTLPTAILSTHTAFAENTFTDLSASMAPTLAHWQQLQLNPAGVYLGYLGARALPVWRTWLPTLSTARVRLVDPVMGDGGRLYRGFTDAYVTEMRALVRDATVMTPNVTEAALLLGQTPTQAPLTTTQLRQMVRELVATFHVDVVITGTPLADGTLGTAGMTRTDTAVFVLQQPHRPGTYYGTGDIFASVLVSGLLLGQSLRKTSKIALTFIDQAIQRTLSSGADSRYGVQYAPGLPALIAQLGLKEK